uniref:Uncharacterized protein n=1 Tax=Picea sitchensis TaxID=3332 RepID=A0A6B9XPL8_PICSI|nr:hypothetical protein Q903MT_gene3886 [Picea sitchensis]
MIRILIIRIHMMMRMNQMIPPGSKQMCVMSKITSMLRNT